ncbi:hypothetical protein NADE_007177 [Nannochloris sp. 'desiccata']|nr:hypothetical protein KSW81_002645 [Chlorella desiccata (nom. nud.)]KAH7617399.1 hypothetical protein NADE_007177 [Chlorella desiccata (nom. nud.)]
MTFRQTFAIARILGCDEKASRGGEPQPELNGKKLLDQIKAFFASEWGMVSKGKRQPSSALEWTLVGDAISLQTHLENLQARKNDATGQPTEGNATTFTSELMEKYDRKPCLNSAIYLNHPECLRVLLDFAAKDGPETFKKVTRRGDGNGDCACSMAIHVNNLDCILEIIHAGFDFFDPDIRYDGRRTSAFAFLVKRASKDPERYLKNFKIILAELQKVPTFDVNTRIPSHRESSSSRDLYERLLRMRLNLDDLDNFPRGLDGENPFDELDFDEDISLGEGEDEDTNMEEPDALPDVPSFTIGGANPPQDAPSNGAGNNNDINRQEEALNPLTAAIRRLRRAVYGMRTPDASDPAAEQRVEERAVEEEQEEANGDDGDGDDIEQSITVLDIAAAQGGIEVLNILLDLGATAQDDALHDIVDYIGFCIDRATYSDNVRMLDVARGMACLEALLDAGADVNAEDPVTKKTPLHLAAGQKCHEVLSLLLERGANPGKCTEDGQTAAEIAEDHHDAVAVDIITRFTRLQRLSTFNRSASQRERNESQENKTEELAEEMLLESTMAGTGERSKEMMSGSTTSQQEREITRTGAETHQTQTQFQTAPKDTVEQQEGGVNTLGYNTTTTATAGEAATCTKDFFTKVEDRPRIVERHEFIKEHIPMEREYVVETRFIGERELVEGRTEEVIGVEERIIEHAPPKAPCE